jgi:hypothetical protein
MDRKELMGRAASKAGQARGAAMRGGSRAGGAIKAVASHVPGKLDDAGSAIKGMALAVPGKFDDTGQVIKALAMRVPARLDDIGCPAYPLESSWGIGFGEFLGGIGGVPEFARPAVGLLDRFGSIAISTDALVLDGKKIPWSDVTAVTFGSPADAVSGWSADLAVKRLASSLPKFPGRNWVIRLAVETLAMVCLAIAATVVEGEQIGGKPIPMTIQYRSGVKRKEISLGLFAALIASSKPGVGSAVMEQVLRYSIPASTRAPSRAITRAQAIGAMARQLKDRGEGPLPDDAEGSDDVETVEAADDAAVPPSAEHPAR